MRKFYFKFMLAMLVALASNLSVSAHDFEVQNEDGVTIYYSIVSTTDLTCAVTYRGSIYDFYYEYSGAVNIPSSVVYNNNTYSVTSIEDYAFEDCSGLTSVTIPQSVTSIGSSAFSVCSGLTSVTIPQSVTSIGDYAFYGCKSLLSVTIPQCVTWIGSSAFDGCSALQSVAFNATNCESMGSSGNIVFSNCSSLKTVDIGNNVQIIPSYAFFGLSSIRYVIIPQSVTSIGHNAFYGCSNLQIVLNKSSLNIQKGSLDHGRVGYYADVVTTNEPSDGLYYEDEAKTKLWAFVGKHTSVTIPQSVTSIGRSAFDGCGGIEKIVISNNVTSIGASAFEGCTNLKSVVIGTGVLSVGTDAFKNCQNLHKLIILPNTTPSGLVNALKYSVSTSSDSYDNSVPWEGRNTYVANNNYSGDNYDNLKVYDYLSSMFEVDGVVYVPVSPSERTCAAIDCTYDENVKDITIGKTVNYRGIAMKVVEINPYVLIKNNHVENINISSEADVQMYFADGCTNVKKIEINSVGSIGDYAFYGAMTNCINGQITLNNSGAIGSVAFCNCSGLQTLTISNTVTNISNYAFSRAMSNCDDGQITLNNSGAIGKYAFRNCVGLQNLTVGNTVTSIGDYAFAGAMSRCTDGQITLNNTGAVGQYAFQKCLGLKTLTVGGTVTTIGHDAFNGCGNLSTANLGESITAIGSSAFSGCSSLETINIPAAVTTIGSYTFSGCSSLETINIPAAVTTIGSYTFSDCSKLANITLPASLKSIENNAFQYSGLTSIEIPAATTEIGDGVFNGCKSLARFEAKDGEGTLKLGYNNGSKGLFYDCPLKEVKIGRNLSYNTGSGYGYSPFYRNTHLEKVALTDIPTEVFTNEFYGCTSLKEVSIGDGVEKIGDYAFSGCSALESFSFGANVKSIGKEAFSDCSNMAKLYAEPSTPPVCDTQALDDINKWNCTLYVPEAAIAAYQSASQWKDFFFMENHDFTAVESTSLTLSRTSLTLDKGEFETLTATVLPENTSDKTVTWTSLDESVVKVLSNGIVLAVGQGHTSVVATCGKASAICHVTVGKSQEPIDIVDGEAYTGAYDMEGAGIVYTRTFASQNWQSLYVPFAMEIGEVVDYFDVAEIYGVHQYDDNNDGTVDETLLEFIRMTNGSTVPNRPYLIRPKQTGDISINFSARTLHAAENASIDCSTTHSLYTLTGVYEPTTLTADMYGLSGGCFVHATGSTLQPGRIYLTVDSRDCYSPTMSASAPAMLRIKIRGESDDQTEIYNIEAKPATENKYSLDGQRVGSGYKGIVIVNGKKTVQR